MSNFLRDPRVFLYNTPLIVFKVGSVHMYANFTYKNGRQYLIILPTKI